MGNKRSVSSSDLERILECYTHSVESNKKPSFAEKTFLKRLKRDPDILKHRSQKMAYTLDRLGYDDEGPIIDIGSGSGLNAVLAVFNGAGSVCCVERDPERFETSMILVKSLGLENSITIHPEDIFNVELPGDHYYGAYSFEVLEHAADLAEMHRRAHGWLKKGACLYGRTGGNGLSLPVRLHFLKEYKIIDRERTSKYYQRRLDHIAALAPDIDDKQKTRMARSTQGMMLTEVEQTVSKFLDSGKIPLFNPMRAPRDPETGEYMERLLNPYKLRDIIDSQGFRTRVLRPYFGAITITDPLKRSLALIAGTLIRLTHPVSLLTAPWLEVLSEKI